MHMLNVALTAIWRLPENDCHPLFCVEGVTITNQQGCNLHMTANGQVLTYPWQHRYQSSVAKINLHNFNIIYIKCVPFQIGNVIFLKIPVCIVKIYRDRIMYLFQLNLPPPVLKTMQYLNDTVVYNVIW